MPKFVILHCDSNQIRMHEEIRSRLNSGNAHYRSVQNLLSSYSPLKNKNTKLFTTVNLPVILHVCAAWSFTWEEERRLRLLKNTMVRNLLRPNTEEVTDTGKICIIRRLMVLAFNYYSHDQIKKNGMHIWRRWNMLMGFWLGKLRRRDQLEDLDIDGTLILKRVLNKLTVIYWPRTGTRGRLL